MAYLKKPQATLFQHLTYDNHYLRMKNQDLKQTINTLEANVEALNRFVVSHYDLSFNIMENVKIITYDGSDNIIACIHTDISGNFVACNDLSINYLPCVINPALSRGKKSKTRICDVSRCFPYDDYPYYGYGYPYYGYGYGYPYYGNPYLYGDDYNYYRGVDPSSIKQPVRPPMKPGQFPPPPPFQNQSPSVVGYNSPGTHIHIHPK
jgi:hypothetical protein